MNHLVPYQEFDAIKETFYKLPVAKKEQFCIAGYVVDIVHLHNCFPPLFTSAFAHLTSAVTRHANLTIYLCDLCQMKLRLPNLDWDKIRSHCYKNDIYFHFFEHVSALSVLNLKTNEAYYIVRNSFQLPWWISGSPLQVILHWWMRERGLQLTHTACVALGNQAVLLTGKGGSGKSTTVLSCLKRGLSAIGEDYCLLASDKISKVHSVYQSAKIKLSNLQLFKEYQLSIKNLSTAWQEKALIFYRDVFPQQLAITASIRAIFALKIGKKANPCLIETDQQCAAKSLNLSTIAQLPHYHIKTHRMLKAILTQVPCYELTLGDDLQKNAELIYQFLNSQKNG